MMNTSFNIDKGADYLSQFSSSKTQIYKSHLTWRFLTHSTSVKNYSTVEKTFILWLLNDLDRISKLGAFLNINVLEDKDNNEQARL